MSNYPVVKGGILMADKSERTKETDIELSLEEAKKQLIELGKKMVS